MSEPRQLNPVFLDIQDGDHVEMDFTPRRIYDEADPKDSSVPVSASSSPGEQTPRSETSDPLSTSEPKDSASTLPSSEVTTDPSSGNAVNPETNASAEKAPILPEKTPETPEKKEPEKKESEKKEKTGSAVILPPTS